MLSKEYLGNGLDSGERAIVLERWNDVEFPGREAGDGLLTDVLRFKCVDELFGKRCGESLTDMVIACYGSSGTKKGDQSDGIR